MEEVQHMAEEMSFNRCKIQLGPQQHKGAAEGKYRSTGTLNGFP